MKEKLFVVLLLFLGFVNAVYAYDTYNVPETKSPIYSFNVYSSADKAIVLDGDKFQSTFKIRDNYLKPLFAAAINWADVLNVSPQKTVTYGVWSFDDYNAMAASLPVMPVGKDYKVSYVNAMLNNLSAIPDKEAKALPVNGLIMLGLGIDETNSGWAEYTGKHALYHGQIPDLYTVMEHEIMHSLGLTTNIRQYREDLGDENYYFSAGKNDKMYILDKDFRVYTGSMTAQFDKSKEIVPQKGMSVGYKKQFDIVKYAPYYVGENTIKVLGGKDNYKQARQAIIDNGGLKNYSEAYKTFFITKDKYPFVYGLPIHPYDDLEDDNTPDEDGFDMSHIELRNSFMSHQNYRNWLIPMEAELALLKDIGYKVDLRRHFGKSYYLNNVVDTFTTGYSQWDGSAYTGAPSKVSQGVGLHIYGKNNDITQACDISTVGEGSFGVRIDGANNTYTLQNGSNINADGKENIALGVTWGKNHTINVENGSQITAAGEDGIAVSFDFGENIFGTTQATKGSYINYDSDFSANMSPEEETNDALIDNFNLAGSITGEKAAIFISHNAHVKNINILDGAQINGDIISEWNSRNAGNQAKVMKKNAEGWHIMDDNPDNFYYTNINIDPAFNGTINGSIIGSEKLFAYYGILRTNNFFRLNNTLKLNNYGNLTVNGSEINVGYLNNTSAINFVADTNLDVQSGIVEGGGYLNVSANGVLTPAISLKNIENTIELSDGGLFNTINSSNSDITINKLNSDNGEISFDLGDTLNIENSSDAGKNNIKISQMRVDEPTVQNITDGGSYRFFDEDSEILDLNGSANVYYRGKKYTFTQDNTDKTMLSAEQTGTGTELGDAANDSTTANYIVTEPALTKDAGTVRGRIFEISGNDINVNGHKGLVVDGNKNKGRTTLRTNIFGAKNANITVKNAGKLDVEPGKFFFVNIGRPGETSLKLNNGTVNLNGFWVSVPGKIKGTNNQTDIINLSSGYVSLGAIDNVTVNADTSTLTMLGKAQNTNWNFTSGSFNVTRDDFLSSNGTNSLTLGNTYLNILNNKASDIKLSQMELNGSPNVVLDIDFKNQKADKFVFGNRNNLKVNDNKLNITAINMMNFNNKITKKKYEIPFVSSKFNNQNLLGKVTLAPEVPFFYVNYALKKSDGNVPVANSISYAPKCIGVGTIVSNCVGMIRYGVQRKYQTPIFKYTLDYVDDGMTGSFVLSRGSANNYNSYNPAIMVAPVAAQLGGYLSQLSVYDSAFSNIDMHMTMTLEERKAQKMANTYASEVRPQTFTRTYMSEKDAGGWFRPYTTFEKVGLKNGPKVNNIMYGAFVGADLETREFSNGWEQQYSLYAGYNGSHQSFAGNSIYQNGGSIGLTSLWNKGNFFTALTANVGAANAEASTMYGHEDIPMLMTGIASKTGYNWELAKGKFIVQPSYLMSYSFINTFDYTNAAGIRVNSNPLHAINITPGLKFIGNLKHGWQPYASIQMVWNIMDKTDFRVLDVSLPELSVKPYVQYGVGVQKHIGERFTGFFQTMLRNGGRNGISLNLGLRWALGKSNK